MTFRAHGKEAASGYRVYSAGSHVVRSETGSADTSRCACRFVDLQQVPFGVYGVDLTLCIAHHRHPGLFELTNHNTFLQLEISIAEHISCPFGIVVTSVDIVCGRIVGHITAGHVGYRHICATCPLPCSRIDFNPCRRENTGGRRCVHY